MLKIIGRILITLIIVVATAAVIYYAKGYRIDLVDNTFIKTGILHIETQPTRANFYLTEEFQDRTPKIVTPVIPGIYNLDIWLEDYHTMRYEIEILPEKSTPLSVFLFKKQPEEKLIEEIQEPVIKIHVDQSRNLALLFIEKTRTQNQIDYEVLKYQTNTRFWQLGPNPSSIYTFSINPQDTIEDISIAPNSKNVLITIAGEEKTLNPPALLPIGKHLISLDTQTTLTTLEEIEEEIHWSHDGESIFWKDDEGIKKINLKEPEISQLIYTPETGIDIIYYDNYTNGEVYILYQTQENSFVTLSKIVADQEILLIEEIYYQNEGRFLEELKQNEFVEYQPFTNSPQSTLFLGKPTEFLISKETQSILFKTEFASYMYDTEEDKDVLISPYKTEFLDFSPDNHKVAFLNLEKEEIGFFIFDKETGNESIKLGGSYAAKYINR